MRSSRIFPRESLRIFNIRPLFFYAETFFERSKNSPLPVSSLPKITADSRDWKKKNHRLSPSRFANIENGDHLIIELWILLEHVSRPENPKAAIARSDEGRRGGEKVYWRLSNRWPHFVVIGRYNKWKLAAIASNRVANHRKPM